MKENSQWLKNNIDNGQTLPAEGVLNNLTL